MGCQSSQLLSSVKDVKDRSFAQAPIQPFMVLTDREGETVHLPAAASSMSDPGSMSPADLSKFAKAFAIGLTKAAAFWASAWRVLKGSRDATPEAVQVYLMWADTGCQPQAEFEAIYQAALDEFMREFASVLDGYLEKFSEEDRLRCLDGHDSAVAALESDITDAQASAPTMDFALAAFHLHLVNLPIPDTRFKDM